MAEPSQSKNLPTSSCGVSVSRPANPHLPFPRPSTKTGQRGSAGGCDKGVHPNTPANSASGYCPRSSSIGKENASMASGHNHEKENEAGQIRKPEKVQSRAATVKGGKKHFMSTTISAASKACAVSSGKKVLVEPIQTSISFSGGKLPRMKGSVTEGLNQKKEVSFGSNVMYLGKGKEEAVQSEDDLDLNVGMASSLETVIQEKHLVNLDPSFKSSTEPGDHGSTSSLASRDVMSPLSPLDLNPYMASISEIVIQEKDLVNLDPRFTKPGDHGSTFSLASNDVMPPLSPLDADPRMVPYEPNFLSPRPRFLSYNHNPCLKLRFQNRFSAESHSNAEVTDDGVSSDGFHIEKDDLCSDVASDHGSYKKEENVMEVFEADHHTSASEADSVDAQVKKTVARHVITRTKVVQILFILASVSLFLAFYSWPVTNGDVHLVALMKSSHLIGATKEVVQGDVLYQESEDQEENEALGLDISVAHTSNEAEEKNMAQLVVGGESNSEHLVPDTVAQVEGIPGDSLATLGVPEANMNTLAGTGEMQSITGNQERTEVSQEETLDARELESELVVTPAEIRDQPITETREIAASASVVAGIAMFALITGLLAAIALFCRRTPRDLPTSQKATQMIEEMASPTPAPIEQDSQQTILASNSLTEVACTGGDMSSSQSTAPSYGKPYGRFTIYEQFPAKQNVGGEEQAVIIPVKRSIRLRDKSQREVSAHCLVP